MWFEVIVDPAHRAAVDLVQEYRDEVEYAGGFTRGVQWDVFSLAKDVYLYGVAGGVRVPAGYLLEVVSHLN
jgi:hypothetical protein